MPLNWIDVRPLSFNTLLLLENIQLNYLLENEPTKEWGIALQANPHVAWYLRHKCPRLDDWVDTAVGQPNLDQPDAGTVRTAEINVMEAINDWIVYVVDPDRYDAQPFLNWDSQELMGLVDFGGKTVIDVGSGTGRLTFTAAPLAQTVFAVEPIWNLRRYLQDKASQLEFDNVFVLDGLITRIPFPDHFADVTMCGHVFGDNPAAELAELMRVTKPGGMVILCPGSSEGGHEDHAHDYLMSQNLNWARFEEPEEGWKRKYWVRK
ncbi:MAG: class I SAM-dependent methyltransferase [Chloroflexi bacterium]|nr:class I SAM-dependent methyltransferase [Chloroflexota bacterium]